MTGRQGRPLIERLSMLKAQFLTLTQLREAGFFVQYDYAGLLPQEPLVYPDVAALFEKAGPEIDRVLAGMSEYRDELVAPDSGIELDWDSGMFSPLDALAAYAIVREACPARVLEIGSGSSTRALTRAIADSDGNGQITCIDPAPRRDITDLDIDLHLRTLVPEDVGIVEEFGPGDVLFIDSSHIMLPGMDVDIQFNRIFPRLAPGVIVHVHDVFLPYDYPEDWQHRRYSEQNALIGWLVSGYFEIVYPAYHVTVECAQSISALFGDFDPVRRDGTAGSLWLRRAGTVS